MEKALLFVGSNPMTEGYLSHSLGKAFGVMWSKNAELALEKITDTWNPDLIVCDYQLNGMNGHQFLLHIKSSRFKHIPVLIISKENQQGIKELCRSVGAEDCLVKPFHATDLNLIVLDILKKLDFNPC